MKSRMKTLRILVALAVLCACVALAHSGGAFDGAAAWGTLCALCPVGSAQIAAASGSVPWGLLPGVVAVLVIVFLLGRAFCSWVCPSQLLKNIFGGHKPRGLRGRSGVALMKGAVGDCSLEECSDGSLVEQAEAPALCAGEENAVASAKSHASCAVCSVSRQEGGLATQGMLLAVLLAVSFVVGFPVFCLLCPIGLVFGTLWALNRVFVLLQPGWELIIFPLMLAVELFAFKRWCSALCPLGFFFGLIGKLRAKLGFGARPVANCETCISKSGCRTCATACPEDLHVANDGSKEVLEACTSCMDCIENCPTKSISIRLREKF